jgi:hypothetical protein
MGVLEGARCARDESREREGEGKTERERNMWEMTVEWRELREGRRVRAERERIVGEIMGRERVVGERTQGGSTKRDIDR